MVNNKRNYLPVSGTEGLHTSLIMCFHVSTLDIYSSNNKYDTDSIALYLVLRQY